MTKLTAEEKAKKKEDARRLKEGKKKAEKRAKEQARLDRIKEKEERKAEKARIKEEKRRERKGLPPLAAEKSSTKTDARAEMKQTAECKAAEPKSEPVVDEEKTTDVNSDESEIAVAEEVSDAEAESAVEETAVADRTEPVKEAKPRPVNYHVSLREDGRWQVKKAKGERAIKLFATQAEAIAFAKERAERLDASVTIHKKDGKIRKQNYNK